MLINKLSFTTLKILGNNSLVPYCSRFHSLQKVPPKICIIGSGPAGFYTAQHILKKTNAEVDIFEKLPVPFGLIRYGVAPDHPEIKVVANAFAKIAQHEKCRFFGNVEIGLDIYVSELLDCYNGVILAYGANRDWELHIPGEMLIYCLKREDISYYFGMQFKTRKNFDNVISARNFVFWYNGHPDYVNEMINLNSEVVAVVGHGNVALDVARILLRDPDELKTTDIAQHALDALVKSKVKKVVLIGRRGPVQTSFTIKELREIINLKGCRTIMSEKDFDGVPEIMESVPRPKKRLLELMYNTAKDSKTKQADKTLEIKFFRTPQTILGEDNKVKKIVLGVNDLDNKHFEEKSKKIFTTGEKEEIDCGLVLRSIGYKTLSIDRKVDINIAKFIVPNKEGRVDEVDGLYCSGWVKTGPKGVILSTMNGSYETAEKVIEDMRGARPFGRPTGGSKIALNTLNRRGIRFTTFDDWLKIDKVEVERGQAVGKPREKICNIEEMLRIAGV